MLAAARVILSTIGVIVGVGLVTFVLAHTIWGPARDILPAKKAARGAEENPYTVMIDEALREIYAGPYDNKADKIRLYVENDIVGEYIKRAQTLLDGGKVDEAKRYLISIKFRPACDGDGRAKNYRLPQHLVALVGCDRSMRLRIGTSENLEDTSLIEPSYIGGSRSPEIRLPPSTEAILKLMDDHIKLLEKERQLP